MGMFIAGTREASPTKTKQNKILLLDVSNGNGR